jgi:general secretion pathway protein G
VAARRCCAQQAAAAADLAALSIAIDEFQRDCGRYPTAGEGMHALVVAPPALPGWHGPYLKRHAVDPWGTGYVYLPPPSGSDVYQLFSAGPDGQSGTADDVAAPGAGAAPPPGTR